MEIEKSEQEEKQLLDTMSQPKEQPIDSRISIEGNIQWKLNIDLQTNQTQILCNQSISNEAATLALANTIITNIIEDRKKKGVKQKETQRLRIAQFELQKLFAQCITYIIDNKDKELAVKENETV